MDYYKPTPRILGAAFIIVAITDLIGGLLIGSLGYAIVGPPENISDMMINVSKNPSTMLMSIVILLIEAIFIVLLAVCLYTALKSQNKIISRLAFGLWIIEAASLAISRMSAFSLLRVSQEYVAAGSPDSSYFQVLGNVFYGSTQFGYGVLLMTFFSLGGLLFYYLFLKSKYVPKVFPIWGIIATALSLVGTLFVLFEYNVPLYVFLPILPLEILFGIWLMVKGFKTQETKN